MVGFLDLPDQPDEPGRLEGAGAGGGDRPAPGRRELPDPDERDRAYEAMRAHVSAETGGEPSDATARSQQDQQADRPAQRGYQDQVPRFMGMWADHEARWPAGRRTSADPSADTPAPHHRDGGSGQHPERQADPAEAIGRIREAEPGLSANAQAIEQENKHGGWLEGFKHRLKGEDRLKQKVYREEFQKVLDSGADGMLYDECFHHIPALACFDPGHGHRYRQPVYAHDVDFIRWLREQSDPAHPEFLYSGEACTNWQLAAYHLSYHRSEALDHMLMRFLRPDALLMTAATGFDDRSMINQCLLYRYVVSYEPYNFKGRLSEMPLTVANGQKMDALRTEDRATEWLWDGEFHDTLGAQVTERGTGRPHAPFAVFRSTRDSSLAVVAANYATEQDTVIDVAVEGVTGPCAYRLVDDGTWRKAADGIHLPPRSAAVVLEHRPS